MRRLWTGDTVDHRGRYFIVENARLFTVPDQPIPVVMAAAGTETAELAAEHADGLWSTAPEADVVRAYRAKGGRGPVYGQLTVCYGEDEKAARALALEQWPTSGVPGQLSQDLPTWTHYEQVAKLVTEDAVAERIVCGPDAGRVVGAITEFVDAGFDHLHLHQVGPDQQGFLRFWTDAVRPQLERRSQRKAS
jgi:G6PDH family F420-dependent oxidoreductase